MPGYVSQRPFAKHIGRSQPWVSQIESLQRRCDVLEFMDFADAHYKDRLELYRQLIALSPRRVSPIKRTTNAERSRKASTPARKGQKSTRRR
jgi:hypothetical protein